MNIDSHELGDQATKQGLRSCKPSVVGAGPTLLVDWFSAGDGVPSPSRCEDVGETPGSSLRSGESDWDTHPAVTVDYPHIIYWRFPKS